jgi:ABC-type molybdate transport system substrate-binding protein
MTNWKTTLSAAGAAVLSLLAAVAAAPAELGDVSTIIPAEWKAKVFAAAAISAFLLRVINGTWQKDKDVTGGNRSNPTP